MSETTTVQVKPDVMAMLASVGAVRPRTIADLRKAEGKLVRCIDLDRVERLLILNRCRQAVCATLSIKKINMRRRRGPGPRAASETHGRLLLVAVLRFIENWSQLVIAQVLGLAETTIALELAKVHGTTTDADFLATHWQRVQTLLDAGKPVQPAAVIIEPPPRPLPIPARPQLDLTAQFRLAVLAGKTDAQMARQFSLTLMAVAARRASSHLTDAELAPSVLLKRRVLEDQAAGRTLNQISARHNLHVDRVRELLGMRAVLS